MLVGAYLRVSERDGDQDTITNQRLKVEEFCRGRGFRIYEWYEDDDISGTISFQDRPEGHRLLADGKRGCFQAVVVWKTNRLGRDTRDILNAVHELKRHEVGVISTTEPFDTANAAGRLMFEMLASFASFERENILQITKAGIVRSAKEGAYLGGIVAYGYRVEGERRAARYVVNDETMEEVGMSEADIVRWIYRHLVHENGSSYSAATYLNARGIPTRYSRGGFVRRKENCPEPSGRWRAAAVYNLIVKPLYKGVWLYKTDGEVIERPVPAIVDEETWARAQEQLKSNNKFSRRNAKNNYLLRSLMKCAHCGRTYCGTQQMNNGKPYLIYRCTGSRAAREHCPGAGLPAEKVEGAVWEHLQGLLLNPGSVLQQVEEEAQQLYFDREVLDAEREAIRREIDGKEDERARVFSLYRRGRMTDAELDAQIEEIKGEELALHRRLQEIENSLMGAEEKECLLADAEDGLREYQQYVATGLTDDDRRRLIETLIREIRVETIGRLNRARAQVKLTIRYSFRRDNAITLGSATPLQRNLTLTRTLLLAA